MSQQKLPNPSAAPRFGESLSNERIAELLTAHGENAQHLDDRFPVQAKDIGSLPKESVGAEQLKASAKELFPQLVAPGKRIHLFGQISAAGAVVLGEGFTAKKTATGKYTIELKTELATTAVCVTAHSGAGFSFPSVTASTKKEVKIENFNGAGALADEAFNFTIDG